MTSLLQQWRATSGGTPCASVSTDLRVCSYCSASAQYPSGPRLDGEARQVRVSFLQDTLERAEKKDWLGLVGFEASLPPLPKRLRHLTAQQKRIIQYYLGLDSLWFLNLDDEEIANLVKEEDLNITCVLLAERRLELVVSADKEEAKKIWLRRKLHSTT